MGSLGGVWSKVPKADDDPSIVQSLQRMSKRMHQTGADRQTILLDQKPQPKCYPAQNASITGGDWGWFVNEAWYSGQEEALPVAVADNIILAIEGQLYDVHSWATTIPDHDTSASVAETLLAGFRHYGHRLWPLLHGQFVIALWDATGDKPALHLVRDRAGIKPLFYTQTSYFFVFGSNIRTVLASGLYSAAVDWQGIWQILSFPAPPQPSTVFEGVKALSRGHMLTYVQGGDVHVKPYWSIPTGQQRKMSLKEAGDRIHHSLVQAVERRVDTNSAIGSLISGGVDSPYLCALLSDHIPHLKALTFAIKGDRFTSMNEHELAAKTAERYEMNHIISFYSLEDIWGHFDKVIDAYEQPGINLDPYYFTGLMAQENDIKYLFNGLSADELHGGFHYFKYIPLWHWVKLFPWLTYPFPRGKSKRYDDLKNLTIPKTVDEYYSHGFSVFQEFEKKALLPDLKGFDSFEDIKSFYLPEGYQFKDDVEGLLHMMYANVPNHHLYRFEQFTQMFGVQAVYPFVDNDAVEVAFQVPSRHKVRRGVRKVALKEAAAPHIYQGSIAMKKKGITMPYGHWINHELKGFVNDKLASLKNRPHFDAQAIDKVDTMYRTVTPAKVWKLVMIELWMEKFIDNNDVLW